MNYVKIKCFIYFFILYIHKYTAQYKLLTFLKKHGFLLTKLYTIKQLPVWMKYSSLGYILLHVEFII